MKIGGPKGPSTPPAPQPADKANKPAEQGFSEVLKPEAAGKGEAAQQPANAVVQQVTEQLRSGEITASQAVEMLVSDIVGKVAANPGLEQQLRAAIQQQLENDPQLTAQLKRLEQSEE